MSTSEIHPAAIKIDKLIHKIEEGDIKIPAFQRGFVWKQDQVIELLDSILHDYPIGSILLWNSTEKLQATRNVGGFLLPDRDPQYPVNYVLDGQQRLSTIYAVFCKDRTQSPENQEYNLDTTIFDIYYDFDTTEFVHETSLDEAHKNIRLNSLFNLNDFMEQAKKLPSNYVDMAQNLQSRFNNYEIPIVTVNKKQKDEVGMIFERINNTGTKLTTLDLMIAWTWNEDFHLKENLEQLLEVLDFKGFGDIPEKIILQALSAVLQGDTKTSAILSLDPGQVRDDFPILQESLEKTIDFLSTELKIVTKDFLPHSHQIVPLTYFYSRVNTPNADQIKVLRQWFWITSFSRRYSAQTDDKMNDDIKFFEAVYKNDFSGLNKYKYSITENFLIDQKFSKDNPYVRAFLLLLAQFNPLNLQNGAAIDVDVALSKYNRKEFHHIFPKAYLSNKGTEIFKINSLCNFCFLPADSNKIITNREPSDYILAISSKNFASILNSNLMPLKKDIYKDNNFDEFLFQRATLIIQSLDGLLV